MRISPKESWDEVFSRSTDLLKAETFIPISETFNDVCIVSITDNIDSVNYIPSFLHCNLCNTIVMGATFNVHLSEADFNLVLKHSDAIKDDELSSLQHIFTTQKSEPEIITGQPIVMDDDISISETEKSFKKPEMPLSNGLTRFDLMLSANKKFWIDTDGVLANNFNPIHKTIDDNQNMTEKYGRLRNTYGTSSMFKLDDYKMVNNYEKSYWLSCEKEIKQKLQNNPLPPLKSKPPKTKYSQNGHTEKLREKKPDQLMPPFEIDESIIKIIMALEQPTLKGGPEKNDTQLDMLSQTKGMNDFKSEPKMIHIQEPQAAFDISLPTALVENNQKQHPLSSINQNGLEKAIYPIEPTSNIPINQEELVKPEEIVKNGIVHMKNKSEELIVPPCTNTSIPLKNIASYPQITCSSRNLMTPKNRVNSKKSNTNLYTSNNINPFSPEAQVKNIVEKSTLTSNQTLREFDPVSRAQLLMQTSPVQPDQRVRGTEAVTRMPFMPISNMQRISSDVNINNDQPVQLCTMPYIASYSQPPHSMQQPRIVNISAGQNNLMGSRIPSGQAGQMGPVSQTGQRLVLGPGMQLGPVTPMIKTRPIGNPGQAIQANAQVIRHSNMTPRHSMGQSTQIMQPCGINQSNQVMQPNMINQHNPMMQSMGINQQNAMLQSSNMTQQEVYDYYQQIQRPQPSQNSAQHIINENNNRNQMQVFQIGNNMMSDQMYMGNNSITVVKNPGQGVSYMTRPRMAYIQVQSEPMYQVMNPNDNRTIMASDMVNQQMQDMQGTVMIQTMNPNNARFQASNSNMSGNDMINFNSPQNSYNPQPSRQQHQQPTRPMAIQPMAIQTNQNSNYFGNNMIGVVNYQNHQVGNQQSMVVGNQNLGSINIPASNNYPVNAMPAYNIGQANYVQIQPGQSFMDGNSIVLLNNNPNPQNVYIQPNVRYVQNVSVRPTGFNPNLQQFNQNNPNAFPGSH